MSDTYQYTSIFSSEPFDIGHFSEDTYILDRLPEVYRMELSSSSMFLLVFYVVILKKRVGDREALRHRRWDEAETGKMREYTLLMMRTPVLKVQQIQPELGVLLKGNQRLVWSW